MPSPTSSLATLRPDLATSFEEFSLDMNMQGFIAPLVFPIIDVASSAGTFGMIPVKHLLQDEETLRAPGSGYNRSDFRFETGSYATQENGKESPVDDNDKRNYANYFDAELIAARRARHAVMQNYEKRVAAQLFNPTDYTGASLTTAVVNEWDDYANATPISDVEAAASKIYDATGLYPNALVINRKVFRNLRNCDDVVDRIQAAGAGQAAKASDVIPAMLAMVFDLEHVFVAGGSKNTAREGQSAAITPIWSSEYAMLCRVATSSDFAEPCIGRTFHWGEDGSTVGGTIESYRDESVRSDVIRCRMQSHEKRLYLQLGHLLSNITT